MNIFDKLIDIKDFKNITLLNMNVEFFALYLNKLHKETNKGILVVTPTLYEANKLYNSMLNYNDPLIYETDDVVTSSAVAASKELKLERLNTLKELIINSNRIVFTDVNGYVKYLPSKESFKKDILVLKENEDINNQMLISKLTEFGYTREIIVNNPGEIAVRGFVLDIFPINSENPIRIEFFGDTIESIKEFSLENQRTIKKIKEIEIYSFSEQKQEENLISYFNDPIVVFKDYEQIKISYERIANDIIEFKEESPSNYIADLNDIKITSCINYLDFDSSVKTNSKIIDFNIKTPEKLNEDIDKINKYLSSCIENNKTVILCLQMNNVNKFLESLTVPYILTDQNNIVDNTINIIKFKMSKGFIKDNYIFLTEYELFNRKNEIKRRKFNYKYATRLSSKDITKLEIGDYIVHSIHGIGIYNGIKTLTKNGLKNDYIEILYAKSDKLYIPASKIELISKYANKEGYVPKINSLNSVAWQKTKEHVRTKIRYEAERLLKVQAERNLKKGFSFSKDTPMQLMFEDEFKYDMTKDQLLVTEKIKKDMENIVPMDHILCGDVGYGKTEVAFRAIFKAVQDSKQVMYLCPTTLLSKQQYESAKERFRNFPVNIGLLNRFTTPKKTKQILEDFKKGKIDVLFGTHRILSNDVESYDLGLLVVDEEQRFGVAHKEKIKEMKSNIDVLTLTATPIPRTLQMAILGLKNLSLIETPPKNRHSVQTYVIPEDRKVIRDIIYKEISREGQVFILYNKVSDIEEKVREIKMLVPDAKIIYAHGKMPKNELEDRMNSFIEKEYNVLVCTTIIETGIDIPNANSLIVFDADKFGLSQLYQIRGRVGRSDRIAYAYLMYSKNKQLNDIAVKRLKVIKEFTELGSGFQIASRDLSIRGAGDILGAEQAGFIDAVGIDLYMKMLEIEILKLKGIEVEDEEQDDSKEIINISNHIKDTYIKEEELKIEVHKLINTIASSKDLEKIKVEIEDRFGKIDNDMLIYMNEELFEKLIKKQGIIKVLDNNNYIELIVNKQKSNSINYETLFMKSINISNNFKFEYKMEQLHIKIMKLNLEKHPLIYLNKLLEEM